MITCKYKCKCLDADVSVEVPERNPRQDVVEWVEQTMGVVIAKDHASRSPWCKSDTMEYVKIPAPDNAPYIGGAPKMDS